MDTVLDLMTRGFEQLVGRLSGPLNFRLVVMPTVVTFLALRADWKDAREGRPTILGASIADTDERRRLFRSSLEDIGRILIVAIVLDTVYQLMVFRWIYPGQALIVAIVCGSCRVSLSEGPSLAWRA